MSLEAKVLESRVLPLGSKEDRCISRIGAGLEKQWFQTELKDSICSWSVAQ